MPGLLRAIVSPRQGGQGGASPLHRRGDEDGTSPALNATAVTAQAKPETVWPLMLDHGFDEDAVSRQQEDRNGQTEGAVFAARMGSGCSGRRSRSTIAIATLAGAHGRAGRLRDCKATLNYQGRAKLFDPRRASAAGFWPMWLELS